MARFVFRLPDVGEGTAEAEIVAWHVKAGEAVAEDQPLVDVMTDKATVEITSPKAGVVAVLHGQPGDMAPVGGPLVELDTEGTAADAAAPEPAPVAPAPPVPKPQPTPRPDPVRMHSRTPPPPDFASGAPIPLRREGERPLASPAVLVEHYPCGIALDIAALPQVDNHRDQPKGNHQARHGVGDRSSRTTHTKSLRQRPSFQGEEEAQHRG